LPNADDVDTALYGTLAKIGNPFPVLNDNPNKPLQDAAAANPCEK
jgi:hypothetical protein